MTRYQDTENKTFTFSSCELCEAECCNGLKHTLMSEIVLDEFENVSNNFPILFILGDKGYLKPVILLSNGKGFCKYIKDFKCTIYDKRPLICRTYPLSMDILNKINIDLSCPALNKGGINILENGKVHKGFDAPILDDYQQKYLDTHFYFHELNDKDNIEHAITIREIPFFRFKKGHGKKYVDMHIDSLKNLDSYFY